MRLYNATTCTPFMSTSSSASVGSNKTKTTLSPVSFVPKTSEPTLFGQHTLSPANSRRSITSRSSSRQSSKYGKTTKNNTTTTTTISQFGSGNSKRTGPTRSSFSQSSKESSSTTSTKKDGRNFRANPVRLFANEEFHFDIDDMHNARRASTIPSCDELSRMSSSTLTTRASIKADQGKKAEITVMDLSPVASPLPPGKVTPRGMINHTNSSNNGAKGSQRSSTKTMTISSRHATAGTSPFRVISPKVTASFNKIMDTSFDKTTINGSFWPTSKHSSPSFYSAKTNHQCCYSSPPPVHAPGMTKRFHPVLFTKTEQAAFDRDLICPDLAPTESEDDTGWFEFSPISEKNPFRELQQEKKKIQHSSSVFSPIRWNKKSKNPTRTLFKSTWNKQTKEDTSDGGDLQAWPFFTKLNDDNDNNDNACLGATPRRTVSCGGNTSSSNDSNKDRMDAPLLVRRGGSSNRNKATTTKTKTTVMKSPKMLAKNTASSQMAINFDRYTNMLKMGHSVMDVAIMMEQESVERSLVDFIQMIALAK